MDPSGWDITVQEAPSPWRHRLLESLDDTDQLKGIESLEQLADVDKLIAVCLRSADGQIKFQIRELDIRTQQWGAILNRAAGQTRHLDAVVFQAITKAFMPIAGRRKRFGCGRSLSGPVPSTRAFKWIWKTNKSYLSKTRPFGFDRTIDSCRYPAC